MLKYILTRLFLFAPMMMVLCISLSARASQSPSAAYSEQSAFIDTLSICKNNINHLDLLPSILNQGGWEEVSLDTKDKLFERDKHLYKKRYNGEEYQIEFGSYPAVNKCSIQIHGMKNIPVNFLRQTLTEFSPLDDSGYSCRQHDGAPTKFVEWKFGDQSYIRYFNLFNQKTMLFSISIAIEQSKVKDWKFFSICKMGNL